MVKYNVFFLSKFLALKKLNVKIWKNFIYQNFFNFFLRPNFYKQLDMKKLLLNTDNLDSVLLNRDEEIKKRSLIDKEPP